MNNADLSSIVSATAVSPTRSNQSSTASAAFTDATSEGVILPAFVEPANDDNNPFKDIVHAVQTAVVEHSEAPLKAVAILASTTASGLAQYVNRTFKDTGVAVTVLTIPRDIADGTYVNVGRRSVPNYVPSGNQEFALFSTLDQARGFFARHEVTTAEVVPTFNYDIYDDENAEHLALNAQVEVFGGVYGS